MTGYRELLSARDLRSAETLLAAAGLELPGNTDFGLGYYEDGRLLGCGFLAGALLCGFCTAPEARGAGVNLGLVSRLVVRGKQAGISRFFLYTRPRTAELFHEAGFSPVAGTERAVLLELGYPLYGEWIRRVRREAALPEHPPEQGVLGAIVMNANPFTLGHRYLAREAARRCDRLLVFVVEEDASVFPADVRFDLVRLGLEDSANATVLKAGPYMVSRVSFPSYFTGQAARDDVYADLDSAIFATRIAPDLGIRARFVGTEPYCEVTRGYNAGLRRALSSHGIGFTEIERLRDGEAAVSASRVRALLRKGPENVDWEKAAQLVPVSTLQYLRSRAALPVLRALETHAARH